MIINSLLDLDVYKFYMMQIATDYFPNQVVECRFKNRTKLVNLKNVIKQEDLVRELFHIKTLKFEPDEIQYLRSLNTFSEKFFTHIANLKLDNICIDYTKDEIEISAKGKWADVILWETLVLSVVNELYSREKTTNESVNERLGLKNLYNKIAEIVFRPNLKLMDFGTRRRYSKEWHEKVVTILKNNLDKSQFVGTSNVLLAKKLDIEPLGTNAHELYMFASGYFDNGSDESLIESQNKIWDLWYSTFGEKLSIALTDTFGTGTFFKNFSKERAIKWRGYRHDSGDPFIFGDALIKFLESHNINPLTKTIVFSDGLDINMVNRLYLYFSGRINMVFGIGTNLTNDVGLQTLSIVMKITKVCVNGVERDLIKLSDNLNKITGNDSVIERYKRAFEYNNKQSKTLYS